MLGQITRSCISNARLTAPTWTPSTTQTRYKRTVRLHNFNGLANPIITEDDRLEMGDNEELKYKDIRFATNAVTSSVFFDRDVLRMEREIMRSGRRELARDLLHRTFYEIKCIQLPKARKNKDKEKVIETQPLVIMKKALENSSPVVITRLVKRGGATYQVPYPITASMSEWFSLKWMVATVKERPKPRVKLFPEVMARELLDASQGEGKVIKRKDDVHKLADANRTYAHYRWG